MGQDEVDLFKLRESSGSTEQLAKKKHFGSKIKPRDQCIWPDDMRQMEAHKSKPSERIGPGHLNHGLGYVCFFLCFIT